MQHPSAHAKPAALRLAAPADLPAINAIYNHYVLTSTCTYQEEPTTDQERAAWFAGHGLQHPVTVAIDERGSVVGWGSLGPFHPRSAYRMTVEHSLYVRDDLHRRGIGKTLLADLIARAQALGHRQMIALISADQPASLELHRNAGFHQAGRLTAVGFKFNRWLDLVYMQRTLTP